MKKYQVGRESKKEDSDLNFCKRCKGFQRERMKSFFPSATFLLSLKSERNKRKEDKMIKALSPTSASSKLGRENQNGDLE